MDDKKKEALNEIRNIQENSGLRRLDQFKVSQKCSKIGEIVFAHFFSLRKESYNFFEFRSRKRKLFSSKSIRMSTREYRTQGKMITLSWMTMALGTRIPAVRFGSMRIITIPRHRERKRGKLHRW